MDLNLKRSLKPMVWVSLLVMVGMILFAGWAWVQIPTGARLPVHWGVDGQPDSYGSKLEALFLVPLITALLVPIFYYLPNIDPRRLNLAQSIKAFRITWGGLLLVMAVVDIGLIVPIMVGVMFVAIGNYMGKIRSNYMFGIRTPWTLTSELSWNKTHRLGGKIFMLIGVFLMVTGFLTPQAWWFYVLIGSILLMVVFLFAYSYLVWKQDPAVQANDHA